MITTTVEERAARVAAMLMQRDAATGQHVQRVAELAGKVATQLGLDEATVTRTRLGGLLHDAGKRRVALEILQKPGALTDTERATIMLHPEQGDRVLARFGIPDDIRAIARTHHERIDGLGYPLGLRGEEIPLETRIVSAADQYDALTGNRPYRTPLQPLDALSYLDSLAGTQLDGTVLGALRHVVAGA